MVTCAAVPVEVHSSFMISCGVLAMAKLDDDPNRLSEIADVLLTIHLRERRSYWYMYMAHVMLAA